MIGMFRNCILVALLCTACMSSRDIQTLTNPDQAALQRLSEQELAYADVTTIDGQSYLGPDLMVFADGVCVSAAHPCVESDRIASIRYGQDKLKTVDPRTGLFVVVFSAAYVASDPSSRISRSSKSKDQQSRTIDLSESPTAWINRKSSLSPQQVFWLSSDRRRFRPFVSNQIPCGWSSLPPASRSIHNDRAAAEYLLSLVDQLPGSCLLVATDLIAYYEPNRALNTWMTGAIKVRWERLQCANAGLFLTDNLYGQLKDVLALEPAVVDDRGPLSPLGFLGWSRLSAEDAQSILGKNLDKFDETYNYLIARPSTFSYDPPLGEICAGSGGVASDEIREARLSYFLEYSVFGHAEPKLFIGADVLKGSSQIAERLMQIRGET